MRSRVCVFPGRDGEIQRVQLVQLESWQQLTAFSPECSPLALEHFAQVYENYLIPACPWVFGNLVLFQLPQKETSPQELTEAAILLRKDLYFLGKKPMLRSHKAKCLWTSLQQADCVRVVRGKLPITTIIPVARVSGYLSGSCKTAEMKVNGSFFIMDPFDCATVYDHVGTCFGLYVKDGVVERPPLYGREALLVGKDGRVQVTVPTLFDFKLCIGSRLLIPGENAKVYTRPRRARAPADRSKKLVIVGRRVEAVLDRGSAPIPASGFVLAVDPSCDVKPGGAVTYLGMEDVAFGIQVGNSILRDGVPTEAFRSPFYNIRALQPVPYPPCLYPLKFSASRAARIALGADAQGKPMLLWAEGAAKLGHKAGVDSCGATLADMAKICAELGMHNAVNLDGGGSAQILLKNIRHLCVSDRNAADHSEAERPVPMGLMVE